MITFSLCSVLFSAAQGSYCHLSIEFFTFRCFWRALWRSDYPLNGPQLARMFYRIWISMGPPVKSFSPGNPTTKFLPILQSTSFTKNVISKKCAQMMSNECGNAAQHRCPFPALGFLVHPMQAGEGEQEIMGCQQCSIGAFHCLPTEHFQKNLEPTLPLAAAACFFIF